jgi:hypothetical protein
LLPGGGRWQRIQVQRAAGASDISIKYPDLTGGCLDTSSGAGALFPQVLAGGQRSDELFGTGFALIGRGLAIDPAAYPAVRCFDLGDASLQAIAPAINAWLLSHGASAVLVRPDRHVFGTGDPQDLLDRLSERAQLSSRQFWQGDFSESGPPQAGLFHEAATDSAARSSATKGAIAATACRT